MCQKEAYRFDINTQRLPLEEEAVKRSSKTRRKAAIQLNARPGEEFEFYHSSGNITDIIGSKSCQGLVVQGRRRRARQRVRPPSPTKRPRHVGRIPRAQGPGEDQPGHHRLLNFQTPLLSVSEFPISFLPYSDHTAVCGQSHRLCPHQRHTGGCVEHILLDPLHIHNPKCLLEADRDRCGSSRNRQNCGSRGAAICQILSMGVLLPILPGKKN